MSNSVHTAEHIAFLTENITGCYYSDLTEKFNQQFGTTFSIESIKTVCKRHGLRSGLATSFKKGHSVWNKGKKGFVYGGVQFRKGPLNPYYRPVGSEGFASRGYVIVKTAEPSTWRAKHRLVWEEAYGPIPANHAIIFADGNNLNVELDNLILVSRSELLRMNENHLHQNDPNLTRSGVIVAGILAKCAERSKHKSTKAVSSHELGNPAEQATPYESERKL